MSALQFGLAAFLVYFAGIAVYHFTQAIVGTARGIRVEAVSVGYGPVLFSRRIGRWEIRLGALPWGGYTKFAGPPEPEDEDPESDESGWLDRASPLTRIVTALSGPVSHLVLGFLFLAIPIVGKSDRLEAVAPQESEISPCAVPGLAFRQQPSSWNSQLTLARDTAGEYLWRVIMIQSLKGWGGPLGFLATSGAIGKISVWGWLTALGALFLASGLFNLLPVPSLSGFIAASAAFEGITSTRISDETMTRVYTVGGFVVIAYLLRMLWSDARWLVG